MWFKNLHIYQFEKELNQNADSLHEALSAKPFVECSATQRESMGWVAPLGKNATAYTHSVNGFTLLTMARQERLLPASVVKEELDERIKEIQDREDRRVGAKEKKELRERIEDELLPRAFTRTKKIDTYIDHANGLLVINTPSASKAEALTTLLRKTIGSLPVIPLKTEATSTILTHWLTDYVTPEPFEIGEECQLSSTDETKATASFRKHELGTDEVKTNLESGKVVSKLALVWGKKVSFTLNDDMTIKKLKFLDVLDEQMNEQDPQSHEERVDIEFTLMTGELQQMMGALLPEFEAASKSH